MTMQDVDVSLGMLPFATVAAQLQAGLPPWTTAVPDKTIFVRRLIARGALTAASIGEDMRVPVESLRDFMRDAGRSARRAAVGLPAETIAPSFPLENERFVLPYLSSLHAAACDALGRQVPASIPQSGLAEKDGSGFSVIRAELTPDLVAIFTQPIGHFGAGFNFGAFRNLGELYLATRLQTFTLDEVQRVERPRNRPCGPAALYQSPEFYAASVKAGQSFLAAPGGSILITARVPANDWTPSFRGDGIPQSTPTLPVKVVLSDAAIMQASGTTPERLACLAF